MRLSLIIAFALPATAFGAGFAFFLSGRDDGASETRRTAAAEPARREAAAYPWEDFEAILGRTLSPAERHALRDLRVEHGLRLAEAHARLQRGEMAREEYDAWRAARASLFRAELERALDCSADEVQAMLSVPMRTAAVP